jgi:amino acid adenylation domain-containing protein
MKEFLSLLRKSSIKVALHEGNLKIDAPKGALTAEIVTQLKANKVELMALLERQQADMERLADIPIAAVKDVYALSPTQRRFYILSRFDGSSTAYNIATGFRIDGKLDLNALEQSIVLLVRKHEVLRTVFGEHKDGEPWQKVVPLEEVNLQLTIRDLSTSDDPSEASSERMKSLAAFNFDLHTQPPFKVEVWKLDSNEHVLAIALHHIITDGWSMGIIMQEIVEQYTAITQGVKGEPPAMKLQYKDYADWVAERMSGVGFELQRKFWIDQFETVPEPLNLPAAFTRPMLKNYEGKRCDIELDSETTRKVRAYCAARSATVFMGVATAFTAVLNRYTDSNDIIWGTPIAGRDHQSLNELIGLFVNTLAIRIPCDGKDSLGDLLERSKAIMSNAFQHQLYPFDQLVDELNLERNLSRSPLFDIMLAFESGNTVASNQQQEQSGLELTVQPISFERETSQFDLTITVTELDDSMAISAEYSTELFVKADIERFLNHLSLMIKELAEQPGTTVEAVDLIDAAEREMLLKQVNPTLPNKKPERTVVSQFESFADEQGEHVALIYRGKAYTYAELNKQASILAHGLVQRCGDLSGQYVGIELENSANLVIGMLAILKTGAAYVPIDPSYPEDRKAFIQSDANLKLVLNNESITTILASTEDLSIGDFKSRCTSDQVAYVIYTSGSTGIPKGVLISHENLTRRFESELHLYNAESLKTTCHITSFCFDVSLLELLLPLSIGGKIVMPDVDTKANLEDLLDLIGTEEVSVLQGTPSFMRMLFSLSADERFTKCAATLKHLCIGGESLSNSLVQNIRQKLPNVQVNNHYGPTEITIDALALCNVIDFNQNSIGKPLPNTSIYLLSDDLKLQPRGIRGEICIGGPCVAKGYLNRDELNAVSFVNNPFVEGEQLYRTGDYGCWLADDTIAFLGRKDTQIKIRGYRVEVLEIENVLISCEGVRQTTVQVRETGTNEKQLAAYCVVEGSTDSISIKEQLKTRLPHYMVPSKIIVIDQIPLTVNGKVDVANLPQPEIEAQLANVSSEMSDDERKLAQLWHTVLGVEPTNKGSNFFELGGNSYNVLMLRQQINNAFDVDLDFKEVFVNQTIESLTNCIAQLASNSQESSEPFGWEDSDLPVLFAVPSILGRNLEFNAISKELEGAINVAGFDYPGAGNSSEMAKSIEQMASQFASDILNFQSDGTIFLLGYSMGVAIAFEMVRVLEEAGREVELILVDRSPEKKEELSLSQDVELQRDMLRLKDLFTETEQNEYLISIENNIQLLKEYTVSSQVKANILTISSEQALKSEGRNSMALWEHHSQGTCLHKSVDADHDKLLQSPNYGQLVTYLRSATQIKNQPHKSSILNENR